MTKNPVVTVLMPTYNTKEEYLKEAIDSILSQTYKNFEFLVIDDGSTDNTEEFIKSYTDKRIIYVKNKKNLGLIKTLNKGLDLAKGKYIARMDSDDISLPDRLKKQVEYLEQHPDVSLVGTSVQIFPENSIWETPGEPTLLDMIEGNCFAHPTVMFRKADFEKHNLRYDENYPHAEDYELWSRAICILKCQNMKEVLLKYRWHAENVSNKNRNIQLQTIDKIKKKLINVCTKDKKRKIVFCMPLFQTGGIERVLTNIVKALHKKYEIAIIIDQKPIECQILDDLRNLNVSITVLSDNIVPPKPRNFIKRKIWRWKNKNKLKNGNCIEIAERICHDADLIIDFFSSNMHHVVSKINLPIPRVAWFHCSIKVASEAKLFDRLPDYQKIIGLTQIFCDELKEKYPNIDISHINNPIDVEKILLQKQADLPDTLKGKDYFVSVARLSYDKDIATLVRAYKVFLDKTNSSTLLCLVGSGDKENEIKNLVEQLGIKDKVILVGTKANPYPFMSNAKACILSSESEASPCVLIEAMICKTLPVCSDCPTGPKELLDYGRRGILFPVKDYHKLAQILEKVDMFQVDKRKYYKAWDEYINELSIKNFDKIFYNTFFKKPLKYPYFEKCSTPKTTQNKQILQTSYTKLFDLLPLFKYQKTEHSVALYLFDFIPLFKYKHKTK